MSWLNQQLDQLLIDTHARLDEIKVDALKQIQVGFDEIRADNDKFYDGWLARNAASQSRVKKMIDDDSERRRNRLTPTP